MIRKNLIIIIKEDINTGKNILSISTDIPGGLVTFDTLPAIKNIIAKIKENDLANFKHGMLLSPALSKLKKSTPIVFHDEEISNFSICNKFDESNETFSNVYSNIYIVNVTNDCVNINCNTSLLPKQFNKDGLFVYQNSIMSIQSCFDDYNNVDYNGYDGSYDDLYYEILSIDSF